MPHSKHDQSLHTHEEVANFTTHGDARGPAWLKTHAEDDRAKARLDKWAGADTAEAELPGGSEPSPS
jgi:hypothetical protein